MALDFGFTRPSEPPADPEPEEARTGGGEDGSPKALSLFWRRDTSHMESVELAKVLRALRKVAGHIGENVGRIEWAGMSHASNGSIVLDPAMVSGDYPVAPERFDRLLGLVVHEAFHRTEWTDLVWKRMDEASPTMGAAEKLVLQKLAYTGEDIYVDLRSRASMLGHYVRLARRQAMEAVWKDLARSGESVEEVLHLWWRHTWGEPLVGPRAGAYREGWAALHAMSRALDRVCGSRKGVSGRCEERARLYLEAWRELRERLLALPVFDGIPVWGEEGGESRPCSAEGRRKAGGVALPLAVADEIEAVLAADSVDVTPIVRRVVGDRDDVAPTSRWDFTIPAHPVIDDQLVGRLQAIFETYAERRIVVSRGLSSGRLDKRRLHRAPINGRCFLEKQKLPVLDWNICLLVDASGSMRGPRWRMVENTVGTLHRAFEGFRSRLQAYAYFEVEGVCMISRLVHGRQLLSVPPAGQTASGQALIVASFLMPRDARRRLLVHVTDGESNFGCDVSFGIDYCREQGIHLVTLGCSYKDREAMGRQYGRTIQFIDHFGQLPGALESLLRWTLVYGVKEIPKARG